MIDPKTSKEFADYVRAENFDFLDFGCSRGGSIEWGKKLFGAQKGLGIDIDPKKVQEAREAGHNAIKFDLLKIPPRKLVRFTLLSHFLEHVPDLTLVETFVRKACDVSKEFVLIKQPYFDSDGPLLQNGFKTYWSDWTGHPNRMSTLDLFLLLSRLKNEGCIKAFSLHAKVPITSSDDKHIHPIASPRDQHQYDSAKHPPKPNAIKFSFPVFYETVAYITMGDGPLHMKPFRKFHVDHTIVDADGNFSSQALNDRT
ncbi:MAG: hypothetical protein K9G33_13035 [Sneathiella sp.]|nr:hypothetical protein [Sneathiella sp.]